MSRKPHVFNMPSGVPFLPSLATGLKGIYKDDLQDALILLPTRRAVRALGEAFVEDGSASLLPRMRPLADINPEEPPFEPGELAGLVTEQIDPMQRRFEIAKLIAQFHRATSDLPLDAAGALALADPLIAILDDAAMEEADIARISELKEIKDFAAAHFQNAIQLYDIIQTYWSERLREVTRMEPFARRVALLNKLTEIWSAKPPNYPVIIAGSTGTLKASARLMACVSRMDKGLIVLPGLNNRVPDSAWDNVNEQHPQNSLKQLIDVMGVERGDVPDWKYVTGSNPEHLVSRRAIISESLVPVDSTGDWPTRIETIKNSAKDGSEPFEEALQGLSVITARTNEEEALTIALILRETLETPGKTAALVTPDPALARRVRARLRRWNVDVDYSQGEPLEETSLGAFLSAVLALSEDPFGPVELADIYKHPLTALGLARGVAAQDWRSMESSEFRGVRKPDIKTAELELIKSIHTSMQPLNSLELTTAETWAAALSQSAESIARTDELSGAERLWVDDAGEKAASLLEGLMAHGGHLGDMTLPQFSRLLSALMRGRVVRPRYGTHPRLSILGPLEARMLNADQIILGGLNETIWPAVPSMEPFLSRGMRKTLKLSLPERRFGLSAHDFAELAANPDVILTRSERSDDGPMVASRWLWRLQTLLRGALGEVQVREALSKSDHYLDWARALDDVSPGEVNAATRPAPTPPVDKRWPKGRKLSVTQIQKWIRDPYSIYAEKILGLKPEEDLEKALDAREYGSAIHKGLENFVLANQDGLPIEAEAQLISRLQDAMRNAGFADHEIAKDASRLVNIADNVLRWMRERRDAGWSVAAVEKRGELELSPQNFTLSGTPDLIETGLPGYAVNDYKTGAPATVKVVKAGFDPQLPLTAFMIEQGAFEEVDAGDTEELNYIRIKGSGDETLVNPITPPKRDALPAMDYAAEAIDNLRQLIEAFDKPETAYHSQPRVQYTHDYGDYDHLARRSEWGLGSDEAGGGHDG